MSDLYYETEALICQMNGDYADRDRLLRDMHLSELLLFVTQLSELKEAALNTADKKVKQISKGDVT